MKSSHRAHAAHLVLSTTLWSDRRPRTRRQLHRLSWALRPARRFLDGYVRKVDKEPAKVSLRPCLIESLDMPGRTMVSHAADPSMLASLKEGHRIRSAADGVNGAPTVNAMGTGQPAM